MRIGWLLASVMLGVLLAIAAPARAIDEAHRAKAREMADRAAAYLKKQQDPTSGGWSVPADATRKPHLPGITALVLSGLLLGDRAESDPAIGLGVKYLLNHVQDDGGIYDRLLPSYNTSLAVSALSKVDLPQAREAVEKATVFLKGLQWSEVSNPNAGGSEAPRVVGRDHPFYGGVGYGKHGRPDGSNLNIFMQAMQDAGVSPADESVKRAVTFLQRLQMLDEVNDMPYADKSRQGGFIYATVENAESVDGRAGQSMAGMIEESLDDGTKVSRLRAYGSMTYAGFKSYLYAELPRDDIRVTAALDWIRRNYTVQENPGIGTDGLYYYYVTFSRALSAWGESSIETLDADGKPVPRDWANDLIDRLAELQQDDGSFKSVDDRWMENDPVLITAYSLIALRTAAK
jgi:squalene-hopene/tetraprenyl-beta-curcumene cyclase